MVNGNGGVKNFIKDAALGAGAGAVVDAFVEVSNFPGLNDEAPAPFQFLAKDKISNAEALIYAPAMAAIVLGLVKVIGGKALIPGFDESALAYGLGAFFGVQEYELQIAPWLGIRDTT